MIGTDNTSEQVVEICRALGHDETTVSMADIAARWARATGQATTMSRFFEFSIEYDCSGQVISADRFCLVHLSADTAKACLALMGPPSPVFVAAIGRHAASATFGVGVAVDSGSVRRKLYVIGNQQTVSRDPGLMDWLVGLVGIDPAIVATECARFGHRTKGYCLDESENGIGLKLYHGLMRLDEFLARAEEIREWPTIVALSALVPADCPILVCSRWTAGGWSRRMELRLLTSNLEPLAPLLRSCGLDPDVVGAHAARLRAATAPQLLYLSVDRDLRPRTTLYFRPGV